LKIILLKKSLDLFTLLAWSMKNNLINYFGAI